MNSLSDNIFDKIKIPLQNYILPECDRLSFLQNYFAEDGIKTSVINLNGKKHLYVNFPSESYDATFKMKTIITHYDRVAGSPGANDNSAANLCIAYWVKNLFKNPEKVRNIRIFFTDGEELGREGVSQQGSYALAELFNKLGITDDDVYVFDACGRGRVAVLAQAGLDSKVSLSFKKSFLKLFMRTQDILKLCSPECWMTLPVPYSDNAGFLACGIPSVAITFLPEDEATTYYKNLMSDKNLEKAVMNCKIDSKNKSENELSIEKFKYKEQVPLTWRLFHTEYDNLLSLTPESFEILVKILNKLEELKIPC